MSSISSSTNRVAGLISGLETEDLVKAMTANTKNRINSKKQKLQTLQWKQDSYRSIIDKISDFQNKYLKIDSSTSIKANKVMKKCVSTSTNEKVITAAASSGADAATYIIKEANKATSASFTTNGTAADGSIRLDFSNAVEGAEYEVTVNLDGADKTITFTGGADEEESKANFLAAANSAFEGIKSENQGFEFEDGTSWLVFNNADDGIYHTFGVGYNSEGVGLDFSTSSKILTSSTLGSIGFAQRLESDSGSYSININGVSFQFTDDTTISDMMDEINNSDAGVRVTFSNVSQSFTFETKDTGAGQTLEMYQTEGNLLNALLNNSEIGISTEDDIQSITDYGSNSTIVLSSDGVNFTTYTSATNTFTFDGTTINVSNAADFKAESEDDYITVETSKDTSALKDLITEFVNDYNQLLEDLYGEINTSRPKSSGDYYDPLTEEQEEEMSDDEIEKWNENAKTGLLYQDSTVVKFLSEIRSAMNTYVDKYGLYNIGVELTDQWSDNGKLEIDEEKLETAINSNGDKLADLFTSENGIAAKLETVINKAISTSTNNYGYLTALAGQKDTKTDTDNQIYKQMQSIQDIIDALEEKYENEQERYWDKFTTLETYMAQMQQQSSYFTSE